MSDPACIGCYYNRDMTAWGETFKACHYKLETGKELYGKVNDETYCSGYDPVEKQLELEVVV